MNTSQLVDKQIMDLTSSSPSPISQPQALSPKSNSTGGGKDFINLMNHPKDDGDQHADYASGPAENGIRKEEILPSYDFRLIRPVLGGDSTAGAGSGAGARSWNSTDAKSSSVNTSSSPVRHYGSLDSGELSKDVLEKDRSASDSAILSEIDRTMKRHTDNMLIVLEGVSSRLMQLESRTRHLESSVDDLKVSVGNNHGSADSKMRQLENILREVQTGVQVVKDKQEQLETQLQLSKLQVSKADRQQPEAQNTFQVDAVQEAASASAPPQTHQQLHPSPVTFPQSIPSGPVPHPTIPSPQQQSYQPVTPPPNHFAPAVPQRDSYYAAAAQTQEPPNPQYQVSPSQHAQPSPAAPPQQMYQPAPQSQYPPQQAQIVQPPPPPAQSQVQHSAGHQSEETSYLASQSYPSSLRHPTSLPPSGPLPSHQYYGTTFEPSSIRPSSGFSSGYSPPSGPVEPSYPPYSGSASQYGSGSSTMKPLQLSSVSMAHGGGGTGYPQLPTARMLPQALPASRPAAGGGSGSGSGSGNRVPVDDVIDKVATMGFPRDQVHEAVRKLTENGQSVDLNVVLDKLMNGGGYYGR